MAYKGNDLDLRPTRTTAPAREFPGPVERAVSEAEAQPARSNAGPIAVDEAVLACCNDAYDVARFHGSEDVRLEHLLHSLTRVSAAAEILTALGIRVDALRRETAVAIAAEMPASPLADHGTPHASAAFEDVLRRTAEQAAKWHAPAGLHDLLRTILGGGPGSPAAVLLMQAAADPQQLERWRDAPLRSALHVTAPEASAAPVQWSRGAEEAVLGRLDHMEAALRALQMEAAADRQAVGDLMRGVQSGLQALRSDSARAVAAAERPPAADPLLESKLGDLARTMNALSERIADMDKTAGSDVHQELRTLMETVEGQVDTHKTHTLKVANRIADTLSERLGTTEAGLQRLQEETARHWSSNSERDTALEASVRAQLQASEEAGKSHERDLGEIYQALVKLGANQQTLGDNFTAWRIESGGDIGIINNRLQQLEQTMLDLLGHFGNELQALRQESHNGTGVRRNGFKRWLYGTGNVFAAIRREETGAVAQAPDHPAAGQTPKEGTPGATKS